MADYNANIRVNADTKGAERALSELEQKIAKLGRGIELGKSVGRGVTEALVPPRALKQIDRELATIASRADTTAKKVARIFEGGATLGVAAKGIQDVSQFLGDLSITAGKAADQVNNLAGLKQVLVPGFGAMQASVNGLAKTISTLEYKFSSLQGGAESVVGLLGNISPLAATAGAGLAIVAGAIEDQLLRAMRQLDTEGTQALQNITEQTQLLIKELASFGLPKGGTLAQFENLLSKGQNRLRNSPAGSPESLRAINTILRAQELITEELRKQDDLLRAAQGLRTASAENRDLNTYNVNQRKKSFYKQQTTDIQELNAALAEMNLGGANPFGIGPDQQQEALLSRYTADMEQLQQVLGKMEGQSRNPFGITAQQIELADHNTKKWQADLEQVNAELADLMQVHRALGQMEGRSANPFGIGQQQIEDAYNYRIKEEKAFDNLRLDTIQRQLNAELDSIDEVFNYRTKANAAALRDFDRRLANRGDVKREASKEAKARNQKMESVALGVGFPLLFGGGAGSVLGSLAGSFVGSGFGGQILGGAIGQALDQFVTGLTNVGKALKDPTEALNAMEAAGLRVSDKLKFNVEQLTNAGRAYEAQALVVQELNRQFGPDGARGLAALAKEQRALGEQWDSLATELRSNILPALIGTIVVVRRFGDALGALRNTKLPKWLQGALDVSFGGQIGLMNPGLGLGIAQFKLAQNIGRNTIAGTKGQLPPLSPQAAEAARKANEQQADSIRSAYREGFQLQRRAADINTAAIDYRRKIESEIFAKRQEVARLEIDNTRRAAQLRIDASDLALRKQFAGTQGDTEELLNGVRNYISTRRNAEADIEQQRRSLEVSLADINKATSDYVYEQAKSRLQLERQIEDYKMDVADYQLKTSRQVQEQQRLDAAASGARGAKGLGQPLEYLTGDRRSPNYRADHGGANYHEHLAYSSKAQRDMAMEILQKAGIKIGSVEGGRHSKNSLHYKGLAFDVPASQVPVGQEQALSQRVRQLLGIGGGGASNQYVNAASQVQRPSFSAIGGDTSGMAAAQGQLAAAKKQEVTLSERLSKLKIDAAGFDLQQLATGKSQTEQLRQQLQLEAQKTAALSTSGGLSKDAVALTMQQLDGAAQLARISTLREQVLLEINDAVKKDPTLSGVATEAIRLLNLGIEQRLTNTREQVALEQQLLQLAQEQQFLQERAGLQSQLGVIGTGGKAGFTGGAASAYETALLQYGDPSKAKAIAELTKQIDLARMHTDAFHNSIQGIGTAFGNAMTTGVSAVTTGTAGAQEVFAQFLNAVAQSLMQTASTMIATYVAIGIARIFAGFSGASGSSGAGSFKPSDIQMSPGGPTVGGAILAANGAYFSNGIAKFAKGGVVSSPTLFKFADGGKMQTGVMGEAGPEAILPLSRNNSGQLGVNASGLREAMGAAPGSSNGSPVLNMSFETSTINGVEYVSREQLEAAMSVTRRQAARDGASRGMSMTLDRLQQSPSTRRRVGI